MSYSLSVCLSQQLKGLDADLGLQCQSANITVLHAEQESSGSFLDLASGRIHTTELSPAFLLRILRSDTPSRWFISFCENERFMYIGVIIYIRRGGTWEQRGIYVQAGSRQVESYFLRSYFCVHLQSLFAINVRTALSWVVASRLDSTIRLNKDASVAPLLDFVQSIHSLIHSTFKERIHHLTVCCLPLCLLCLHMLMSYKSKFALCHLHPRCSSSKTDPQRLAALHYLLVYMGNDPNLELKVQMKAGKKLGGQSIDI